MSLHARYTVIRKIADGGTAEIFLATQHGAQGFQKSVVLKRIHTAYYADPQFRNMLIDEAHVAMSLNHSNIVQVLDLGEAAGRYFLALELVDGWTSEQILRRAQAASTPFPTHLALYVAGEVCRALAYAHGQTREGKPLGIVHRDISTHNVLISEQGEVKLTDFGIAKVNKREQSTGDVIKGKVAFMSPEQASGTALDARSDIFSMGTMLYVLATGRRPFEGATDYETLLLVRNAKFSPPTPGLNPQVSRIMLKALRKNPAERYQKVEEMQQDIERVMRIGFPPVGQSELKLWLYDLQRKDGALTLTKAAAAAAPTAEAGIVVDGNTVSLIGSDLVAMASRGGPPALPADASSNGPAGRAARPRNARAALVGGAVLAAVALVVGVRLTSSGDAPEPPPPAVKEPVTAAPPTPTPTPELPPPPPASPQPTEMPSPSPSLAPTVTDTPSPAPSPSPSAAPDEAADSGPKSVSIPITSQPEGALVRTRTRVLGQTPLTFRFKPGISYELAFQKEGYLPAGTRLMVSGEAGQKVSVRLKKEPAPPPLPRAQPARAQEPKKKWYWPF